jgi:hypothetical protein
MTVSLDQLEDALGSPTSSVVRLPALVKGELILPPEAAFESLRHAIAKGGDRAPDRFVVDGAYVLRRPIFDRSTLTPTGQDQFLLLPRVDPRSLLETNPGALADLFDLPFAEVTDYVGCLRDVAGDRRLVAQLAAYSKATSPLDDRPLEIVFEMLPAIFDPSTLVEAVERELSDACARGVDYLDGWVPVGASPQRGMTARIADRVFASSPPHWREGPYVRAMPTRQLHITAGNSPVVPLVSALRAFATKGAAVVKSPATATAAGTFLGVAMRLVDPDHPLTRHTSIVYWPGGDRAVEDVLFDEGAFDRLVVWGSAETVRSVAGRAPFAKTVFMNPRVGMSFIGREAFDGRLREVAARAAADSLAGDQLACTASLVHYVEGSEHDVLEYCRVVRDLLAGWDAAVPHTLSPADVARLRRLRRDEFVSGTWFENGRWPATTSLVVYMPTDFDLAAHPMCRCVVVRAVRDLGDALRFVHAGVSTVGVYPEERRRSLRDGLAARGVSNIFPLGEGERVYAGMPHDGMRVLSELVRWTNA